MNAKAKGTKNEHRSRSVLESLGYRVTRSAGSAGEWDLVAISSKDILLVQCKTNRWPSAIELEAMKEFPAPQNAKKLVHRWRPRRQLPDVREI